MRPATLQAPTLTPAHDLFCLRTDTETRVSLIRGWRALSTFLNRNTSRRTDTTLSHRGRSTFSDVHWPNCRIPEASQQQDYVYGKTHAGIGPVSRKKTGEGRPALFHKPLMRLCHSTLVCPRFPLFSEERIRCLKKKQIHPLGQNIGRKLQVWGFEPTRW